MECATTASSFVLLTRVQLTNSSWKEVSIKVTLEAK